MNRSIRNAAWLTVLVVAALALPASAQADSIVYEKAGDIFLATPDGSRHYRVTNTGTWVSPSQADDGTIVALGNDDRLHRMNQRGEELNAPVPVLTSGDGISSPLDPVVSPDGTKIAYWYMISAGYYNPECNCQVAESQDSWRVTDSDADTPESKYEAPGSYIEPSWIDNGRLLGTYLGSSYYPSKSVATDTVAANKASRSDGHEQWFSDVSESQVTLSDGEMTRDFKQMAFVRNGEKISFYTVNGFPADVPEEEPNMFGASPDRNPPTPTCRLGFGGAELANLSWSPDGTRLAFHVAGEGIYVVDAPNPDTCAGDPATLIVPGGRHFDWGPADVPAGTGAPDQGTDEQPPNQDSTSPVLSSLKLTPARFRTGAGRGATISYSVSELAAVVFVFERILPGRRSGKRCVAQTRRNRKAKRCKRAKEVPGGIVKRAEPGPNSFKFTGRVKKRKLAPGSYRLSALAADAAGNQSDIAQRGFKVVR